MFLIVTTFTTTLLVFDKMLILFKYVSCQNCPIIATTYVLLFRLYLPLLRSEVAEKKSFLCLSLLGVTNNHGLPRSITV